MKYMYWTKMSKLKIIFFTFLLVGHNSLASILNLDMEQSNPGIETRSLTDINIKNQKLMNPVFNSYNSFESRLSRDYEFIFFYSFSCTYCKNFAPVLKRYSDSSGINIRGFILGGNFANQESNYFPNSTVVNQEVIKSFFGSFVLLDKKNKGKGIAVPALFIMNKKNLHTYPVSQGALTYSELVRRMDELIPKILNYEKNEKNERNGNNEAKMIGKEKIAGKNYV